MKKIIILILSLSISMGSGGFKNISSDPFKNKKKVNYSLNDIINYPIGIFSYDKKYFEYKVSFDRDFKYITITENFLKSRVGLSYVSSFDNYINTLYSSNQKFNLSQPLYYLLQILQLIRSLIDLCKLQTLILEH